MVKNGWSGPLAQVDGADVRFSGTYIGTLRFYLQMLRLRVSAGLPEMAEVYARAIGREAGSLGFYRLELAADVLERALQAAAAGAAAPVAHCMDNVEAAFHDVEHRAHIHA